MPLPPFRRESLAGALVLVVLASVGLAAWSRLEIPRVSLRDLDGASALDAPIAADERLASDTLGNGLRYYIRENRSPAQRVEVRLVVNAGSVLEDDDQRGLAHAVEHMVFRGTRGFPGGTIDEYMESIGMRRGEGANATTSYDETVYRLSVPADRAGLLDSALAMLAGLAHDATFDPADARGEAGIVLEEWRSRRDARQRLTDERDAILLAGSAYANRPVIGDTAVLRRFDVRAMRRYYDRWYRPELMAVVAVGDLETKDVRRLVEKHFGRIPRGTTPLDRPAHAVARATGLRASVLTDVEATGTRVSIWHRRPPIPFLTRSDYRTALVAGLWRAILAARLEDAAGDPGSPIVDANVEWRRIARPITAQVVSATVMKGDALPALERLAGEMRQLARGGATPLEVEEHTAAMLRQARGAEQAGEASDQLAGEFVDHFLTGNAPISRALAAELASDLLPTLTSADVTAFARRFDIDGGAVVIVTAGADDAAARLRAPELIARAHADYSRAAEVRKPPTDVDPLIAHAPTPGRIASEREVAEANASEWTLSNGMRVILRPSRTTLDEIQFRAVAPGGASLASDEDYPSAWLSDVILQRTGIGGLTGTRLDRLLDATSISLAPSVSDDAVMLTGSTAPHDLERFLQLVHLYFTAPRSDSVAFRRYRDRATTSSRNRDRDPDAVFLDTVAATVSSHHPRGLRNGARFYESATLPKALEFWSARVSNASAFTVVLTGDFTLGTVRPLVERYLASLPAGVPERPRDLGRRLVTGVVHREVVAGIGGRARTRLVLSGPLAVTQEAAEEIRVVRDLLELTLDERLRESLGGTYGVSVEADMVLLPPTSYTIAIDFDASPGRIDALTATALEELERLRTRGPTEAEFAKTRVARMRDYDGEMESNDYWTSELSFHARLGWPLASIAQHPKDVERLTLADLRRACATYIPNRRYTRVTLRPRRGAAP